MADERLWCPACQKHAAPEQETGDCFECGESCWTSKDAWLGRAAGEQFVAAVMPLSADGRMEALHSISDLMCLYCGADRKLAGESPCCRDSATALVERLLTVPSINHDDDELCHNYDDAFDGTGCRQPRGHDGDCGPADGTKAVMP